MATGDGAGAATRVIIGGIAMRARNIDIVSYTLGAQSSIIRFPVRIYLGLIRNPNSIGVLCQLHYLLLQ